MYCTKCGKEISNSSAFCPYCGNPVKKPDSQETNETGNTTAKETSTNAQSTTAASTTAESVAKKKKKGRIIGIVVSVALLAIACKALFLVDSFGGKSGSLAGVYEANNGDYYIFAKDGSVIHGFKDEEYFSWGDYDTIDDDELQIINDVRRFSKKGNNLKLIYGENSIVFDGTKVDEAPKTVRPVEKVTAQSLVGTYISPQYSDTYYRFFADGSYQHEFFALDGTPVLKNGAYTVEDGILSIDEEDYKGEYYTEEYLVRIEADRIFLYHNGGIDGVVYLKESDNVGNAYLGESNETDVAEGQLQITEQYTYPSGNTYKKGITHSSDGDISGEKITSENSSYPVYSAMDLMKMSWSEIVEIYGEGYKYCAPEGDPPYYYYASGCPYEFEVNRDFICDISPNYDYPAEECLLDGNIGIGSTWEDVEAAYGQYDSWDYGTLEYYPEADSYAYFYEDEVSCYIDFNDGVVSYFELR